MTDTLNDPEHMAERKYREEEVKEIFDLAASAGDVGLPPVSDDRGLTLAELQEVGLEVGMEPGRIAEAALAVDHAIGTAKKAGVDEFPDANSDKNSGADRDRTKESIECV